MDFACWLHNRAWMVRRCSASRVKRCCEHPDNFLFASDLSIPYLDIGSISSSFLDCGYIGYVCFKSSYGKVFSFQIYEILLQFNVVPSIKFLKCLILFHRRRKKRNGTNFVASNTTNESSFQHGVLSTFKDTDATHATANRSQCGKTKHVEDCHASSERIGNQIDKNEENISIKIVSHFLSFSF